jgi:hypothetical protein
MFIWFLNCDLEIHNIVCEMINIIDELIKLVMSW